MKTVCVESPLAGDFVLNIAYARVCVMYCIDQGVSPYASHLLLPQVMDDTHPEDRERGIRAGMHMGDACDERWFFTDLGISNGMSRAYHRHVEGIHGKPTRMIQLGDDWRRRMLRPTPGFGGPGDFAPIAVALGLEPDASGDDVYRRVSELRELSKPREWAGLIEGKPVRIKVRDGGFTIEGIESHACVLLEDRT